ncbi:Supervillin [Liparis tanakae]|uniref:Supervillin n=1 Tax=Liparis tanakae TaxID=230148 RepID=A0A4Z2FBB5_9TELE|nr:Supervillin [Liparis tanakae]
MDGIGTLQSSAPETKAERIARYKAERRRELAERYGNTEEIASKYVRRDRKAGDASETVSSETKEKGKYEEDESGEAYARRGSRNRAADAEEEDARFRTDSGASASHLSLLKTDDPEEPTGYGRPSFCPQDREETEDGSSGRPAAGDRAKTMSGDEEEPPARAESNLTDEADAPDEPSWTERRENASTAEEKPSSLLSDRAPPFSRSGDASSPPPSPPPCQLAALQRQDSSGSRGIRGILKKSRSTSMESDHSEGAAAAADCAPARQTGVTLNPPESEEEMEEEEEEEEEEMEEEEREMEDDVNGGHYREDESVTDGGGFSIDRPRSEGSGGGGSSGGGSGGGGSGEETRSSSPGESLEKTSSVSEDVEELGSSLDGSQGSSLKQRLAEFTSETPKKPKTSELSRTPLSDRFGKLHDAENAWMKKVEVSPQLCVQGKKELAADTFLPLLNRRVSLTCCHQDVRLGGLWALGLQPRDPGLSRPATEKGRHAPFRL